MYFKGRDSQQLNQMKQNQNLTSTGNTLPNQGLVHVGI